MSWFTYGLGFLLFNVGMLASLRWPGMGHFVGLGLAFMLLSMAWLNAQNLHHVGLPL